MNDDDDSGTQSDGVVDVGASYSAEALAFDQKYVLPPSSKDRGVRCPSYQPEADANDWLGFDEHVDKFAGDLAWT